MIVSEKDAKTKWCPQARVASPWNRDVPINRVAAIYNNEQDHPPGGTKCLGSGCMLWRWLQPALQEMRRNPVEGWEHVVADPDDPEVGDYWLQPLEEAQARRLGYCGLAGKPHAS